MKHQYKSRVLVIAVGVVMVMASHPAHTDHGDPDDPATIGSWQLLPDLTEIFVVHAALLPTGKVLMFAGEAEQGFPHLSMVWDPITNEQTIQGPIEDDLFCAGHAHLADGRLLIMGGDGPRRNQTYVFDPWTETWTKLSDMENGRWYPTGVTLADGRVVVFSGLGGVGNPDEVEIWDPATEEWTTYPPEANRPLEIYPGMHLMPNGNIFYSGTRWNARQGWGGANSAYFDPTTGEWQELGPHVNGDRSEAISVLLPELEAGAEPWRVMVAGGWAGGPPQQNSAEIINLADANPQWVNITPMNFQRNNVNAAILPDGDIAMVAGISGWKGGPFDATLTTEHFDPVTETWQATASMQVVAQYHSIGLLLPDGRVLKTGGHPNIRDMEVYSPAYLFNGPRPIIDAAPAEIGWAQEFSITTPNAANVTLVSLVKLGQITHHTNPDQRFLSLAFEKAGDDLLMITSPAHGNIAPPGYYMLFILNDRGVPSESAMIRIGPPTIRFEYPDGRPERIDPTGGTRMRVEVTGVGVEPQPGTGKLHYFEDDQWVEVAMDEIKDNVYDAVFPSVPCLEDLLYYLSAETTEGETFTNPFNAPDRTYSAIGLIGFADYFADNFETDQGWSVVNENLQDGAWERGTPFGSGDAAPDADFDGSGQCYVTGNRLFQDVDGGPTRLITPEIDLEGRIVEVHYARYFVGGSTDRMQVEISNDGGGTWTIVEELEPDTSGWVEAAFVPTDFIDLTGHVHLRFSVADQPNNSFCEAGLDGFLIIETLCGDGGCVRDPEWQCDGDVDGDGQVNPVDSGLVQAAFGSGNDQDLCNYDMDCDGQINPVDAGIVQSLFGTCEAPRDECP